jgi:antitoxin MazE
MEGTMKVSKWGNSLAIRLPAELVAQKGLKIGDEVEADISKRADVQGEVERRKLIEDAWKEFDRVVGRIKLPADYKFDRDEANSRG